MLSLSPLCPQPPRLPGGDGEPKVSGLWRRRSCLEEMSGGRGGESGPGRGCGFWKLELQCGQTASFERQGLSKDTFPSNVIVGCNVM